MFDGGVLTRTIYEAAARQNLEFLQQQRPVAPFMVVTQIRELAQRARCSIFDLIGVTEERLVEIARDIEAEYRSGKRSPYRAVSPIPPHEI